jgi:hypothetical protein
VNFPHPLLALHFPGFTTGKFPAISGRRTGTFQEIPFISSFVQNFLLVQTLPLCYNNGRCSAAWLPNLALDDRGVTYRHASTSVADFSYFSILSKGGFDETTKRRFYSR